MREILFLENELSQDEIPSVKGIDIYHDEQAVLFLLEVLCGLHSPVLGETEVMGQFKTFLSQIPEDHLLRREQGFLPFPQNATKEARTKFLSATGSLSYGQIVRRWLKDMPDVALWGYGSLGQELWPWMREKTSAVVVRQPRVLDTEVPFVVGREPNAMAHVIAAPLSDEVVRRLADRSFVIDLRDGALDHPNVRTLQDLFAEITQLRREREDVVPRCREFLRSKVDEYFARHQIRPFGWEDLCG